MSEEKILYKLTDKSGGSHYYVKTDPNQTLARFVQSVKLNAKYDEWLNVYEDIMLRNKAAVRLSEIYLVQEIRTQEK